MIAVDGDDRGTGKPKRPRPVVVFGTMGRDTTRAQRALHHKLKMQMKRQARDARYRQGLRGNRPPATP